MTENLTPAQKTFLEECNLEFSERFTDGDLEYKEVYDTGIPRPPIMHPWNASRGDRRNRGRGYGRFNDRHNNRYNERQDYRGYGDQRPSQRHHPYYNDYNNRR